MPATPSPGTQARPPIAADGALKVNLLSESGRLLTSEPVTVADLNPLRSEAWLQCFLRKGMSGVPLSEISFRITPILRAGSDRICAGFALEATPPRGGNTRCEFGRRALVDAGRRGAARLLEFGVLQPGDHYQYEIAVDTDPRRPDSRTALELPGTMSVQNPPLYFLSVPLRPLLRSGRAMEDLDEESFHVFYTESAFAAAEQFSRKGATAGKSIETGAALAGFLCLASDANGNGDLFVVVTDALEAVNSDGTEFSLTYTSESWARISRIMSARQKSQRACRLCGSAHGHNFHAGEPCAACFRTTAPCGVHNVAPSGPDLVWTTSVFALQPWALCLLYGANARREPLSGLFTLRQGQLQRRGYFIVPDFDPESWKTVCATDLNPK